MLSYSEPPCKALTRLGYVVPDAWTSSLHNERRTTTTFLDRLYRIPDPNETAGEFDRYHHLDLTGMPLGMLRREERRVERRLDLDEKPPAWLWERLGVVQQAIACRQAPTFPVEEAERQTRASQSYADPYFSAPERRAGGIPAAVIQYKEASHV